MQRCNACCFCVCVGVDGSTRPICELCLYPLRPASANSTDRRGMIEANAAANRDLCKLASSSSLDAFLKQAADTLVWLRQTWRDSSRVKSDLKTLATAGGVTEALLSSGGQAIFERIIQEFLRANEGDAMLSALRAFLAMVGLVEDGLDAMKAIEKRKTSVRENKLLAEAENATRLPLVWVSSKIIRAVGNLIRPQHYVGHAMLSGEAVVLTDAAITRACIRCLSSELPLQPALAASCLRFLTYAWAGQDGHSGFFRKLFEKQASMRLPWAEGIKQCPYRMALVPAIRGLRASAAASGEHGDFVAVLLQLLRLFTPESDGASADETVRGAAARLIRVHVSTDRDFAALLLEDKVFLPSLLEALSTSAVSKAFQAEEGNDCVPAHRASTARILSLRPARSNQPGKPNKHGAELHSGSARSTGIGSRLPASGPVPVLPTFAASGDPSPVANERSPDEDLFFALFRLFQLFPSVTVEQLLASREGVQCGAAKWLLPCLTPSGEGMSTDLGVLVGAGLLASCVITHPLTSGSAWPAVSSELSSALDTAVRDSLLHPAMLPPRLILQSVGASNDTILVLTTMATQTGSAAVRRFALLVLAACCRGGGDATIAAAWEEAALTVLASTEEEEAEILGWLKYGLAGSVKSRAALSAVRPAARTDSPAAEADDGAVTVPAGGFAEVMVPAGELALNEEPFVAVLVPEGDGSAALYAQHAVNLMNNHLRLGLEARLRRFPVEAVAPVEQGLMKAWERGALATYSNRLAGAVGGLVFVTAPSAENIVASATAELAATKSTAAAAGPLNEAIYSPFLLACQAVQQLAAAAAQSCSPGAEPAGSSAPHEPAPLVTCVAVGSARRRVPEIWRAADSPAFRLLQRGKCIVLDCRPANISSSPAHSAAIDEYADPLLPSVLQALLTLGLVSAGASSSAVGSSSRPPMIPRSMAARRPKNPKGGARCRPLTVLPVLARASAREEIKALSDTHALMNALSGFSALPASKAAAGASSSGAPSGSSKMASPAQGLGRALFTVDSNAGFAAATGLSAFLSRLSSADILHVTSHFDVDGGAAGLLEGRKDVAAFISRIKELRARATRAVHDPDAEAVLRSAGPSLLAMMGCGTAARSFGVELALQGFPSAAVGTAILGWASAVNDAAAVAFAALFYRHLISLMVESFRQLLEGEPGVRVEGCKELDSGAPSFSLVKLAYLRAVAAMTRGCSASSRGGQSSEPFAFVEVEAGYRREDGDVQEVPGYEGDDGEYVYGLPAGFPVLLLPTVIRPEGTFFPPIFSRQRLEEAGIEFSSLRPHGAQGMHRAESLPSGWEDDAFEFTVDVPCSVEAAPEAGIRRLLAICGFSSRMYLPEQALQEKERVRKLVELESSAGLEPNAAFSKPLCLSASADVDEAGYGT